MAKFDPHRYAVARVESEAVASDRQLLYEWTGNRSYPKSREVRGHFRCLCRLTGRRKPVADFRLQVRRPSRAYRPA